MVKDVPLRVDRAFKLKRVILPSLSVAACLLLLYVSRPAATVSQPELLSQDQMDLLSSDSPDYDELHDAHTSTLSEIKSKWPDAFDRFQVVASPAMLSNVQSFSELNNPRQHTSSTLNAPATSSKLQATSYDRCEANSPFNTDTDYQGSDIIKGGIQNLHSAIQCCQACLDQEGCKYFTWGTNVNKCWLKSNRAGSESQLYRTSGAPVEYTYPPSAAPTFLPTPSTVTVSKTTATKPAEPAEPVEAPRPEAPVAPPATVTYVTHHELKLALHLLAHNLLHYLKIQIQGLGDDMQPAMERMKHYLRSYIDQEVALILRTSMHGSLRDLKVRLLKDLTHEVGSYVHLHHGAGADVRIHHHLLGRNARVTSTHVRELPHGHAVYKDKEALRGLRQSAQYMINGHSTDPLGDYGAEPMIPTHIVEHKNVKSTEGRGGKCDPLAGWKFSLGC